MGIVFLDDMLNRKVARKLSPEAASSWNGPKLYIYHLAVQSSSQNTPTRIVFNFSQESKGTSLNNCLVKGPESYRNICVGILLRWREEHVALVWWYERKFSLYPFKTRSTTLSQTFVENLGRQPWSIKRESIWGTVYPQQLPPVL